MTGCGKDLFTKSHPQGHHRTGIFPLVSGIPFRLCPPSRLIATRCRAEIRTFISHPELFMPVRFDHKIVLVTGATSGLGRDAAIAFAAAGAKVVATGRRPDAGAETLRRMREAGGEGIFIAADLGRPEEAERVVAAAVETFGGLDVAYNVAGISGDAWSRCADYDINAWNDVIASNLSSVFYCMKYEIPAMQRRGGGAIVNMSSVAGVDSTPGGVGYVASKHAIVGLTKAAALEYAPEKIRINAVAPAVIETEMLTAGIAAQPGLEDSMIVKHPIGRFGQLAEVTRAVLWLCSDEASYITGTTLMVDGGYTIHAAGG
jgi:NAD(P)-dependent dehydrogenase (short-subunit alcohol dehydrogenase family)